jgi:hypothetical protein
MVEYLGTEDVGCDARSLTLNSNLTKVEVLSKFDFKSGIYCGHRIGVVCRRGTLRDSIPFGSYPCKRSVGRAALPGRDRY